MRFLIDGYNLMHAAGRMNRKFGPDGLRRARLRFLNELGQALGPEQASQTTIVFDASSLPINQAPESSHKGMTVIYAIEDDDADSRIELLIERDSAPRSLTVVSTDRRIRRAAQRRRATSLISDDFLDFLDSLRERRPVGNEGASNPRELPRPDHLSSEEVEAWAREFGEFDDEDEVRASSSWSSEDDWTDADLQRVAREVEREFKDVIRPKPRRSRQH
jgi:uncharacterized protein